MRVLSWNLYHGRSRPGAGRSLLREFATALAGWEWDVALLQEVPPWWPPALARVAGAEQHSVLTSRNFGLRIRRAVADRNPDLIKSGGGGANTILVRGGGGRAHSRARLAWLPERRWAHGIRLEGGWVVNLHASVRPLEQIPRDVARARAAALDWADGLPVAVGGDFNLRAPSMPGFAHAAHSWVDHVFTRGWESHDARVLDAGRLSDHKPLAVELSDGAAVV
jgi:endonuclease/exonuclease/phosphatase family metal-dependent hydrolase